jgi:hypothetical protein
MSEVLFRWTIAEGMPNTATFSRADTATFVSYTFPDLSPETIRATSYSGVSIVVRDARGGDTL